MSKKIIDYGSIILLALAIITTQTLVVAQTTTKSIIAPTSLEGYEIILEEDFTDGNIPPDDPYLGSWDHQITSSNETWYIDDSYPYSDPYCATVHRGNYTGIQDEWLITPSLDFSHYDEIKLRFHWYTSQLTAQHKDVIDLNVSITLDDGANWTMIWSEDAVPPFPSWNWQESQEIDLSLYNDEPNVKIGFQYYSNNITDAYAQEYSIDDIQIYGNSTDFWCTTGGPYEISWSWNLLNGIQFHGNAGGGQQPYLNWTWDFGDGHTSKVPYFPVWSYDDVGTYNISLVVTDSARPKHIAFHDTNVTVIETPPPDIEITLLSPSLGIAADIENKGTLNVSYIDWTMDIEWGPMKAFKKEVAKGTIPYVDAKSLTRIQSPYLFFGFGFMRIIISVEPLNTYRNEVQKNALKIGPLILWVQK